MNVYIIHAEKHNGNIEQYCPMGCCTDKNEMLNIAKRLKRDKKQYRHVYIICKVYQKLDSFILEVD